MKEENKERVEAHKKMYEDLVLWLNRQFDLEIKILLPSAKMTVREWYSYDEKELIQGASVCIEITTWYDSETMDYLCQMLGAKSYRVTAYPLYRMHLVFKVPIANNAKGAMTATGMWIPYWKNDGKE